MGRVGLFRLRQFLLGVEQMRYLNLDQVATMLRESKEFYQSKGKEMKAAIQHYQSQAVQLQKELDVLESRVEQINAALGQLEK